MLVYKLLRPGEADEYDRTGEAPLSPDDARDGYVHLSTAAQLPGTLERHFAGEKAVRLLAVDAGRLGEALRWEPSRGGDLFPHFYGCLRASQIADDRVLARDGLGKFRLPAEIGT